LENAAARARHDASYTPDAVESRDDHGRGFNPFPLMTAAQLAKIRADQAPDIAPTLNDAERWLARLFLRRYATYLVRRRRYAQAQGAAILARELGA